MKICFLALASYPTLTGTNLGYAGGAEVEQVSLGRELVAQGYDVCFVTYAHGGDSAKSGNIEIFETYNREMANKIGPAQKYANVLSALRRADAGVYFHESGAVGVLPIFSMFSRAKFVYRVPSDTVVLLQSISGSLSFSMRFAHLLEIKCADIVLAQTCFQKKLLRKKFGVESLVLKNGLLLPPVSPEKSKPPIVLWVGSISSIKRPHLFLELARRLPFVSFEMVGGRGSPPELYDEIEVLSRKIPNLKFRSFVPYAQVNDYFEKASVFVNTSSAEGFPNTFIQAWANSVPVVSVNVNPDQIITNQNLGFLSKDFNSLVFNVHILIENNSLRDRIGRNCRLYVEREHDIKKIAKCYLRIFEMLH